MSDEFKNLSEVAKHFGVSGAAVTGWKKKPSWPGTLNRESLEKFVREWVNPHRRGGTKKQLTAGHPALSAQQSEIPDPATASLEDLERAIRQATSSEQAELLSKQVRSLKVIREIQQDDKVLINAEQARTEVRSVFHFFQSAIVNVPRSVAASCEGMTASEIESILDGRLTEILGELKRGLQRAIEFETDGGSVGGNGGKPDSARASKAEPDGGEIPDTESASE